MRIVLIFYLSFIFIKCSSQDTLLCQIYDKHKTFNGNGLTYEDIPGKDFYKLYQDNIIFKIGQKYAYSIDVRFKNKKQFITLDGIFNEKQDSSYSYMLYKVDTINNPYYQNYNDQSPYFLRFFDENQNSLGYEYTGCIENFENFWLHPINTRLFRSTYRLPWPFYIYNSKNIGDVYFWNHKLSDFYSINEIAPFKGVKDLEFRYEVKDIYYKLFNNKYLKVIKIHAINSTDLTGEFSEFEFNCTYGFLSMRFYFSTGFEFIFRQLEDNEVPDKIFSKYFLNDSK